jgi:hypothetical protein
VNETEESEEENLEVRKSKLYHFVINPGQTLNFLLKFSPKEVKTYKFWVPIFLQKFGFLPTMQKPILCRGLKPKFLIEP